MELVNNIYYSLMEYCHYLVCLRYLLSLSLIFLLILPVHANLNVVNNKHPFTGDLDNWDINTFWIKNATMLPDIFYKCESDSIYFNLTLPFDLKNLSIINDYDINITLIVWEVIQRWWGRVYQELLVFCNKSDEISIFSSNLSFKLLNSCYYLKDDEWVPFVSFNGCYITGYDALIFLHYLTISNQSVARKIYRDKELSAWRAGLFFKSDDEYRYLLTVSNLTHILASNITIERAYRNGERDNSTYVDWWSNRSRNYPFLYKGDVINVSYNFTNLQDAEHHGMAFGVVANVSWDRSYVKWSTNPLSKSYSINAGNVSSGEKVNIHKGLFELLGSGSTVKSYFNFNISDEHNMYNDSLFFTYFIVSPSIQVWRNSSGMIKYGKEEEEFIFIKNNASDIKDIEVNVTYFKVTAGGLRIKKIEYFNLSSPNIIFLNTSTDLEKGETTTYFLFNYTPLDSGPHEVKINVSLKDYNHVLYSSLSFNVSFGRLKINTTFPFYRILYNQTGNITAFFIAEDGDLWFVNFSFYSFDDNMLHVINHEKNLSLFIPHGGVVAVKVPVSTLKRGFSGIVFRYVAYNYTSFINGSAGEHIYRSDVPKIVSKNNVNISEGNQHIYIYVVGNLSKLNILQSYLRINKSLFSEVDTLSFPSPLLSQEYSCYKEEDEQTSKNLRNISVIVEDKDIVYAGAMLDDSLSTYTTFKSYSNNDSYVIIDFGKRYLLANLSILGFGSDGSTERIYLYVNSSGTWQKMKGFEEGIDLPENEAQYINISLIRSSVRTRYLMINITGEGLGIINNVDIWTAAIKSPEVCYNFSFTYDKVNRSGNYNITSFIRLESGNSTFSYKIMFVNYGILKIKFCNATLADNTYFSEETKNLTYIYLIPIDGDIMNITTILNISTPSIINFSSSESPQKYISYLSYIQYNSQLSFPNGISEECTGYLLPYNLTAKAVGDVEFVHLNITSDYYGVKGTLRSSSAYYGNITVRPRDTEPPIAYWMNITYLRGDANNYSQDEEYNTSNINQPLYVSFSAEDNVLINQYSFEFCGPDGKKITVPNKTLSTNNIIEGSLAKGIFYVTIDKQYFPEIGNYTNFTLFIYDMAGNSSTALNHFNITIYNTTNIRWEREASTYNRGQYFGINTYSYDNNMRLDHVEYNLTLYKKNDTTGEYEFLNFYSCNYTDNVFLCNSSHLNTSSSSYDIIYNITYSYDVGDYSLQLLSNASGNRGERIINFSVTNKLKGTLDYAISSDGSYVSLIFIHLYYQNDLDNITDPYIPISKAYIKCSSFSSWALENGGEPSYYIPQSYAALPSSQKCPVPTTLYLKVSDYYNNTLYITKDVSSPSSSQSSSSTGGGGGGGGTITEEKVVYVNNTNMTQPKEIKRSEVSITPNTLTLIQHQIGEVYIGYENTGDVPLHIHLSAHTDCDGCLINISKHDVTVEVGEGSNLLSTIYVPLFQPPGKYKVSYIFTSLKGARKEKILILNIKDNELILKLNELKYKLDALEKEIKIYESSGVNVYEARKNIKKLKDIYNITLKGIKEDNYILLLNNLHQLENITNNVESSLEEKRWIKILRDNFITLLIITISIAVSMLTFFFYWLPLMIINFSIAQQKRRIRMSERTRISTEKQYFARKIDKATFRNIMSKEEDNILKAKQELSVLLTKRHYLVTLNIRGLRELKKELELKQKQKRYTSYSPSSSLSLSQSKKESIIKRIISKLKFKK